MTNADRAAELIYSHMSSWDDETQATNATQALADAGLLMPDHFIDAERVREVIADWGDREVTSDAYTLYRQVLALLPAPALPRPEDVPTGEPWIVQHESGEWIGCRNNPGSRLSWFVIGRDYHDFDYCYDGDITLISRLVPEVKP